MPEHYHIVTDNDRKPSEVVRFLNGISARRVIDYLKENNFTASLEKLRKGDEGRKEYKYSLWEHHSNTFLITSEFKFSRRSITSIRTQLKKALWPRPVNINSRAFAIGSGVPCFLMSRWSVT